MLLNPDEDKKWIWSEEEEILAIELFMNYG